MVSLIISFLVLILGYLVYGRLIDKAFAPDSRETPAVSMNDGVDYIPIKKGKIFLIQLLNIAGTGPIFGALMGAVFGPIVFLWIVFGSILGGAVHDYMSGMISCRNGGRSIAELSSTYLGSSLKHIMRVVILLLLILAEWLKLPQEKIKNRLFITLPLFVCAIVLTRIDFNILWRYFAWINQTLSAFTFWVASAYLIKEGKNKLYSLFTAIPGTFMSAVSMTYILSAPEGFSINTQISYPIGVAFAIICFAVYLKALLKKKEL